MAISMATVLKDNLIIEDRWRRINDDADMEACISSGKRHHLLLPLAMWVTHREHLEQEEHRVGVWLDPGDALDDLLPQISNIPLVAIHFPRFTDGRGYSLACLLRQRHGFAGELRATGDILRDQIYILHRCGFNAFCLRTDQPMKEALAALRDYSWQPFVGR